MITHILGTDVINQLVFLCGLARILLTCNIWQVFDWKTFNKSNSYWTADFRRQCYIIILQHFSSNFHKIKNERPNIIKLNTILQRKIRFYEGKYNFTEKSTKNTKKNMHFTIVL